MMTLQQLDMSILLWIQEHLRIAALTPFWKVITFLGNGGWFWLVAAAVLLIPKKTRRVGITALLSITIGFLITNVLLKNIVARPRPFDAYSSDHQTNGLFIPVRSYMCILCVCAGFLSNVAKEIWSSGSSSGGYGSFFQTLSGCTLSW